MAFELGFLVGSLLLLAGVLYFTRFRGPTLPHEAGGDAQPATQTCEICGEERYCEVENGMTVCLECNEELL
jgi:hypothetical protein